MVHIQSFTRAIDSNDDRQSHRGLGGGHYHDEEDEHLPAERVPVRGEGNKRKVHAVQHQLDRHENRDDVALDQEPEHAAPEQDSTQYQIVGERDHLYPSSFLVPRAPASGRLASTTAPMMAIRISTDVTSKGSKNSWNRSRAISLGPPHTAPIDTECVVDDRPRTVHATTTPPTVTPGTPSNVAIRLSLVRASAPAVSSMMVITNNTM